jgi:hypothetical protein
MKRSHLILAGTILWTTAILSACGSSGSNSCVDEGNPAGLVIDIVCADPPTRPFYAWDPNTPISFLEVRRTSNDVVAWSVLATEGSLPQPIRQGEIPINVQHVDGNEADLEAGVEYRISLFDPDHMNYVGQRTFTILP